jgi:hypothetical protein
MAASAGAKIYPAIFRAFGGPNQGPHAAYDIDGRERERDIAKSGPPMNRRSACVRIEIPVGLNVQALMKTITCHRAISDLRHAKAAPRFWSVIGRPGNSGHGQVV